MQRQFIIGLLVATLVVTAGCINQNPSNGDGDFPSELSQSDAENHQMMLNNSSSFQTTVNVSAEASGVSITSDRLYRIDRADEQFYSKTTSQFLGKSVTEKYTNSEATFERSRTLGGFGSGNYTYDYAEAPYNESSDGFTVPLQPVNTTQAERGFAQLGDVTLEQNGTTQYAGETVGVYTGDTEQVKAIFNSTGEGLTQNNGTVNSGQVTFYLNDDGFIVYQELSVSGTTENGQDFSLKAKYQLTNINSTDVKEPSWTEKAREESQNTTFGAER